MKNLVIGNQKGGVGKTTTAVNVAAYFSAHGKRVLLIDGDQQGHSGTSLGVGKGPELARWLRDEEPLQDVVRSARPGLDVVRSNKKSEGIKVSLQERIARELYIGSRLANEAERYDLVIVDLAPGSDVVHLGFLAAADYFIVPAPMQFLGLDGVVEVINSARALAAMPTIDPPMLAGVLPTMYERRPNNVSENLQRLSEIVPPAQILPPIARDVRVPEAAERGLPIWEYAPSTTAVIGYPAEPGTERKALNSQGRVGGYLHLVEILSRLLWGV